MGHKSTINLTREEALDIILSTDFESLSDELLSEIVEAVRGGYDHGHNYMIVEKKNEAGETF